MGKPSASNNVKAQYEAFPYPSRSLFALPRVEQTQRLAWERGREFMSGAAVSADITHEGKRILVAGCGTFEAVLVAMAHPRAAEIVAVDLSERSIARLQRRLAWARWALPWRGRSRLPAVRCVVADLWHWHEDLSFDYIVASNVLHHVTDPGGLLARLARSLAPGGLMRVVTYPAASRIWLRQVGAWLRWHGIASSTRSLPARARDVIATLPPSHPIRLCFESHSESDTATGIVDAFLHACEQPLTPLAWATATRRAGLELLAEDQHPLSCSELLLNLLPHTAVLSPWERLEILDRALELSTNPVWWFKKRSGDVAHTEATPWLPPMAMPSPPATESMLTTTRDATTVGAGQWTLPSAIFYELSHNAHVANRLLARAHLTLTELLAALRVEIGAHFSTVDQRELPGLALSDYDEHQLQQWHAPWSDAVWLRLQERANDALVLYYDGQRVPGETLARQAQWLQLRHGAFCPLLSVELRAPR